MPLPEISPQTFHHMALASRSEIHLTPVEAEGAVQDYLDKLGKSLSSLEFEPNGSLHCIVFGEWGHGKSHVLYRTEAFVAEKYPDSLGVRIILESMTAEEILQQFRARVSSAVATDILDTAIAELADQVDPQEAMVRVAKAICDAVAALDKLHTVLLFDEVQKMRRETFQILLQELRQGFQESHRFLHSMQCHSMASLDDTKKLRAALGNWMLKAERIQLPSIDLESAHAFYQRRISDCNENDDATNLIGQGLARTLCEATGGNPREMLQIAGEIYIRSRKRQADTLNPEVVMEELSTRPGPNPGTRLFDQTRLDRIRELIPQVANSDQSDLLLSFIDQSFPDLYVNRREYSVSELVSLLNISDPSRLQWLLQTVDGIKLFSVEEDPIFETTQYRLSDEFRQRLSDSYAASGTLSQKELQFNLILTPERRQRDVVDGLAKGLRFTRFAAETPHPITLGSDSSGNALRGYIFNSPIGKSGLTCPILVTAVCGFAPSEEFVADIVARLKSMDDYRAFLLFYHPELAWSQWIEEPEPADRLSGYVESEANPRVIGITEENWGEIAALGDEEEASALGVRFAAFFARVAGLSSLFQNETEENRLFAERLHGVFVQHQLELEDLCYLPTDEERNLLDPVNWAGDWKFGASLSAINSQLDNKFTKGQLERLVPQFLNLQGKKYTLAEDEASVLARSILTILKQARKGLELSTISTRVLENNLIPGSKELCDSCVSWLLSRLKKSGRVDEDLLGFEVVDITKDIRELRSKTKRSIGTTKKRGLQLQKIEPSRLPDAQDKLKEFSAQIKGLPNIPREQLAGLKRISQDVETLDQDITTHLDDIIETRRSDVSFIETKFDELLQAKSERPDFLQAIILPTSVENSLKQTIERYMDEQKIEKQVSEAALKLRRQALLGEIKAHKQSLESTGQDARSRLIAFLANEPKFTSVTIEVEAAK